MTDTTNSTPPRLSNNSINWLGMYTLYYREVWRFGKVWNQTVLAPVANALLFLGILTLALGGATRTMGDMPFASFVAPGLVIMSVIQNAFSNTSSSLMLSKIQGVIIDILMPPIKGFEVVAALMLGGVTRGIAVAIAVMLAISIFVPFSLNSLSLAIYYIVASAMLMSLLGILGGILAQTFDQMSSFSNYIITPLAFLSGTFYSIKNLPPFWQEVTQYNPFFYIIDGFRYAITGHADGNIMLGMSVIAVLNITLFIVTQHLFTIGWRMKT